MATSKGYILPLTVILTLALVTSLGVWYRNVVLSGYISERMIRQRGAYRECQSLLPHLRSMLEEIPLEDLEKKQNGFLLLKDGGRDRWIIHRSAWKHGKVVFTFEALDDVLRPVRLSLFYERSEES